MATVTKGRTFVSGETVTPAKLNELVDNATVTNIQTADIADGQITNAKVSDSAAIALSKLATGALPTAITVASANLVSSTQQSLVPAGAVMPFAMNSAPSGWLSADGSAVSRTDYSALFAAIGTTHGAGNGSTTFNLPDLRGIFVRGSGSQTISGTTYAGTFAAKQQDAFKAHTHTVSDNNIVSNGSFGATGAAPYPSGAITRTTSSTGDTETRPANIALLYCIKF